MASPAPGNLTPLEPSRAGLIAVVMASGTIGCVVGTILMPSWQVAVESAQVLAGLVEYPPENAFNQYHLKSWSLINQITALPLSVGLSERTVSLVLSGFIGALSFVSLSLCTFALCGSTFLSILSPLALFALYSGEDQNGVLYPIFMSGTHHTYGVLARGMVLFIFSVFGLGYRRLGFLLVAIAPAVHVTWGLWCFSVVILCCAWERFFTAENLKKYGVWFLVGAIVCLVSLVFQWQVARGIPAVSAETQSQHLEAFMAYWDGHRGQVPLLSPGLYLTCVSVVLGVAGILLFRREGDGHGVFVMRAFVVTGTLGMLACVTTWFPGLLPDIVSTVMPGRFANASIYAYAALLLGLMGRFRHRFACQLLMLVHLLYVPWNWFFLQFLSSDKYGWQLAHWKEFVACAAVLMCLLAFKAPTARVQGKGSPARWFTAALASMVLLILGGIAALDGARRMTSDSLFEDDAVLATASEGQGMLIGGPSMELVQLRTGRPVLLNTGGLDQLPFVPSSGPEMNRVLKGVYGIDLLDPPEDIKRHRPGALLPNSSRELWESRSSEEWQAIHSEFGATEVLASADWELDLPVVVRNGRYALYRIPETNKTNRDSNHF